MSKMKNIWSLVFRYGVLCVAAAILVSGCGSASKETSKAGADKSGKSTDPALVKGDSETETVKLVSPKAGGGDNASTFKWKKVDGAKSYQLVASNKDGKATWAQEVQGVEVEFPKWRETDSIATWSVTAIDGDGHVIAASGVRDW